MKLFRPLVNSLRQRSAKKSIVDLTSHRSLKLQAIGQALSESLPPRPQHNTEDSVLSEIEKRRKSLLDSERVIKKIDFGAGSPSSTRSKSEMASGVEISNTVAEVCGGSKSEFWAHFLFRMIRKTNPVSCVELGSCVGISAAYQAYALKLNQQGKLLSLEGSPQVADIASETLSTIDLEEYASIQTGPFNETLLPSLQSMKPVDYLFNDGHHDHDAVLGYFDDALLYLADEAIVVIDDISWSDGMKAAWSEIESHERVSLTVNLRQVGIAVIGSASSSKKEHFNIPL